MMRKVLAAGLVLALTSMALSSDNWAAWRGPTHNGVADPSADPPTTWDGESGLNIRWKAPLPGKGSATPAVWGDRIFVLSASKTDREATEDELPKNRTTGRNQSNAPRHYYKFFVTCFDRQSGKKLWEHVAAEKVPHEGHHGTHSYAGGSPTTDGERLYASFGSIGIFCYDLSGKPLWNRDLGDMKTRNGFGEAVTPVLHGDNLLLNWDQEENSALYCLDAKTGETRWRAERDERTTWTTPLVVEHEGRTQVVMNGSNRVRSHDLASGKVLWSIGGMTSNPIPSPVRVGEFVVTMSGYRGFSALAIPLDATGDLGTDGKIVWRYDRGTPYVPSPVVVGDRLYFTEANSGRLTVLNTKTGKPVIDREPLPGLRTIYSSPIFAGGRVYFVDRAGVAVVVKPGDSLEVLATNRLGDNVDASPVAVGKQLFLRGEKFLHCIEEK